MRVQLPSAFEIMELPSKQTNKRNRNFSNQIMFLPMKWLAILDKKIDHIRLISSIYSILSDLDG
jgi:hypothetical protein